MPSVTKSYSEIREEISKLEIQAILVLLGDDKNDIEKSLRVIANAMIQGKISPSGMWIGRVYLINNAKLLKFIAPQEQLRWCRSPKGAYSYMRILIKTFSCKTADELLAAL
jgi:hypothetical protein